MLFLPLTWDIAVAIIGGGRRVEVYTVDRDQVRAMSVATAARAMTIAGRAAELVNSLATGGPYSGVVFERGMGDGWPAQVFSRHAPMGEVVGPGSSGEVLGWKEDVRWVIIRGGR